MKNIIGVLADQQWTEFDNGIQSVDVSFPWPPDELRAWVEKERSQTSDPGEIEDLESVSLCLSVVSQAVNESDALVAAEFGIQIGQYLARYETRSKRRFFSRGEKAIAASTSGGKKGATVTNLDHKGLWLKYQSAVDTRMAQGDSYARATQLVADTEGVSQATVKLHTVNPDPRNRGGWPKGG